MTAEFLIAALLLTSPPAEPIGDVLPAPVPDAWLEALRPSLIALAVDAEIIDAREVGQQHELSGLQAAWQTMLHAPRVGECERFPPRPVLDAMLSANRARRNYLAGRLAIDLFHDAEIREEIGQLDCLHSAIEALRDAASPTYYVQVRRSSLASFRDRIGAAAWARGELPAAIPGCGQAEPPVRVPQRMPR